MGTEGRYGKKKKVEDLVGVGSELWDEPFVIGGDKK